MIEPRSMRRERSSPRAASDDRDPALRHARSLARIVIFLFLAACSPSYEQRAVTAPLAPSAAVVDVEPLPVPADARRFLVRSERSSIGIVSGDIFGNYRTRVPEFRGFIWLAAHGEDSSRVFLEFDLRSLDGHSMVAPEIRDVFLEVDRFPIATLDVLVKTDGRAHGTLDLHGMKRAIDFRARLERIEGGARLLTTFDLDRRDFAIHRHDTFDWMAKNDFRVTFDLKASIERVMVEEVD